MVTFTLLFVIAATICAGVYGTSRIIYYLIFYADDQVISREFSWSLIVFSALLALNVFVLTGIFIVLEELVHQ